MFKYTIRKGTQDDLEAICHLQSYAQEKAFSEITEYELKVPSLMVYHELWKKRLNDQHNDYIFYVACQESTVLGFIYCRLVEYRDRKIALVKALYVNPTHWGLGIGLDLLKHLDKDLVKNKVEIISLFILDQNKRAERLYKKIGFKFDSVVRKVNVHKQEYYLRHMVLKRIKDRNGAEIFAGADSDEDKDQEKKA